MFQAAAPLGRAVAALDAAIVAANAQTMLMKPFLFAVARDAEAVGTGLAAVVARAAEAPGAPPPPPQVVAAAYGAWRVLMRNAADYAIFHADMLARPLDACESANAHAGKRADAAENAAAAVAGAVAVAKLPALPGGEAAARRVFGARAFQTLLAPALPLLTEHAAAQGEAAEGDSPAAVSAAVRAWRDCLAAATGTLGLEPPDARAALEQGALELARDAPGVAAGLFEYAAAVARRAAALLSRGDAPAAEPADAAAMALKFALVSIKPSPGAPQSRARRGGALGGGAQRGGRRAGPARARRARDAGQPLLHAHRARGGGAPPAADAAGTLAAAR